MKLTLIILLAMLNAIIGLNAYGQTSINEDFGLSVPITSSRSEQVLIYNGDPIQIVLSVGQERRIVFENTVEIGVDNDQAELLNVEIYGQSLLITPLKPINARIVVGMVQEGVRFPLDLRITDKQLSLGPVRVVTKPQSNQNTALAPVEQPQSTIVKKAVSAYGPPKKKASYIDLIRFAAQQFYSPERLVTVPRGTQGVEVINKPVRLIRYQSATTTPVASWLIDSHVVTAIRVKNNLDTKTNLDPRNLIGRWLAASFYNHYLTPKGTPKDESMLFLVSKSSFEDALGIKVTKYKANDETTDDQVEPMGGAK